jgi:hypothetical protein
MQEAYANCFVHQPKKLSLNLAALGIELPA